MYVYIYIYIYIYTHIHTYICLVTLGGSWHEERTLLVTPLSLPILAHPFQLAHFRATEKTHTSPALLLRTSSPYHFRLPIWAYPFSGLLTRACYVYIYIYIYIYM